MPINDAGKCVVRGCPFPRANHPEICTYHEKFYAYPISLTSRHIGLEDLYKDRDDTLYWPTLSVQPLREVFWKPHIRVVINGVIRKPIDPYSDRNWGAIEAARLFLCADRDAKPSPGKPNRLSTTEVINPDGTSTKTVLNRQCTGAFVLWKGFGKKKIRKSQRMRPQGWHGNHPEQKPLKRWDRQTIADIPSAEEQRVTMLLQSLTADGAKP